MSETKTLDIDVVLKTTKTPTLGLDAILQVAGFPTKTVYSYEGNVFSKDCIRTIHSSGY